jgi:hypothetical protein
VSVPGKCPVEVSATILVIVTGTLVPAVGPNVAVQATTCVPAVVVGAGPGHHDATVVPRRHGRQEERLHGLGGRQGGGDRPLYGLCAISVTGVVGPPPPPPPLGWARIVSAGVPSRTQCIQAAPSVPSAALPANSCGGQSRKAA